MVSGDDAADRGGDRGGAGGATGGSAAGETAARGSWFGGAAGPAIAGGGVDGADLTWANVTAPDGTLVRVPMTRTREGWVVGDLRTVGMLAPSDPRPLWPEVERLAASLGGTTPVLARALLELRDQLLRLRDRVTLG